MTCKIVIKKVDTATIGKIFIRQNFFPSSLYPRIISVNYDIPNNKNSEYLYYVSDEDTTDIPQNIILNSNEKYLYKTQSSCYLYPLFDIIMWENDLKHSRYIDYYVVHGSTLSVSLAQRAYSYSKHNITRKDFEAIDFYCNCCNKLKLTKDQLFDLFDISYKYSTSAFEETFQEMLNTKLIDYTVISR